MVAVKARGNFHNSDYEFDLHSFQTDVFQPHGLYVWHSLYVVNKRLEDLHQKLGAQDRHDHQPAVVHAEQNDLAKVFSQWKIPNPCVCVCEFVRVWMCVWCVSA